jgi:hypothetical protein
LWVFVSQVSVRALLREASEAEVVEALERNPGSAALRERGWTPAWFELDVDVDGEESGDRNFSVIWIEPGRAPAEVAEEELELALEEALRNLRDYEGLDVEREDIGAGAIELRVTV